MGSGLSWVLRKFGLRFGGSCDFISSWFLMWFFVVCRLGVCICSMLCCLSVWCRMLKGVLLWCRELVLLLFDVLMVVFVVSSV